ncbi:MAG: hypothetical protein K5776_03215 [Lachnospiraceae bacterium]|nr:hypothetical protein [Lachnospiraceae bacterium]
MFNLYKANLRRLTGNIFFIGGCAIALAVTFCFSKNILSMEFLGGRSAEARMYFVSSAMIVFFTLIVPIFTNMEYSDGTIRNKIIAGHSQKNIYLSYLLAYFTQALIMWGVYMAAGFLGGAKPSVHFIMTNIIMLFAIFNYIATMMFIAFRFKKIIFAAAGSILILNICFNSILFGNLIVMLAEGRMPLLVSSLYNISALGQWFVYTGFCADEANPGMPVQILISLIIVLGTTFLGTLKINKRDLA